MTDQPLPIRATREVATSNRKSVIATATLTSIFFSALALRSGNPVFLIAQGAFGLAVCASTYLRNRGFDRTGRYVFLITANGVIFTYADSLPESTLIHLFFLLAVLFPVFVRPSEDWKGAVVPTTLAVALWSACLVHGPGILMPIAQSPNVFSPFYAVVSVVLILGTFLFNAHRRFQRLCIQVEHQTAELARQDRMVALAQLAAEVAHDVNNPLTLILAKAERISRRTREHSFDEQIDADAQRVIQTVDRIAKTISRLRVSAHLEIQTEHKNGSGVAREFKA